ncbi:uncharacterized protein LOC143067567 [Mytilus galloprovincialis]|uniref:uncharacterized protein LOC143067567 n=1 Tax=Mytilus galloprovincialis TaxID=29158 RepID=UPI003F7C1FFA
MLETIKTFVISYDVLLYIFLSRAVYLMLYSTDENIVENIISSDRLDPDYLTKKQLFSLLDSRGEVFRRSADRSRLVTLARTKVSVEESEPPILADLESLTISDLKHLLDQRGIMYYRRSTKHDLIGAVNISGPVTIKALSHMTRVGEPTIGPVHEFNAFNFMKTLEKYNDSIFLLNILPPRLKSSYFNESSWNALRRKLTYMDFKFGELDCDFEKSGNSQGFKRHKLLFKPWPSHRQLHLKFNYKKFLYEQVGQENFDGSCQNVCIDNGCTQTSFKFCFESFIILKIFKMCKPKYTYLPISSQK